MFIFDQHLETNFECLWELLFNKNGLLRAQYRDGVMIEAAGQDTRIIKRENGYMPGYFVGEAINSNKIRLQVYSFNRSSDVDQRRMMELVWLLLETIEGRENAEKWRLSIPEGGIKSVPLIPALNEYRWEGKPEQKKQTSLSQIENENRQEHSSQLPTHPSVPVYDTNDEYPVDRFFDYYHDCKGKGFSITLGDIAKLTNFKEGTIKHKHQEYIDRHNMITKT